MIKNTDSTPLESQETPTEDLALNNQETPVEETLTEDPPLNSEETLTEDSPLNSEETPVEDQPLNSEETLVDDTTTGGDPVKDPKNNVEVVYNYLLETDTAGDIPSLETFTDYISQGNNVEVVYNYLLETDTSGNIPSLETFTDFLGIKPNGVGVSTEEQTPSYLEQVGNHTKAVLREGNLRGQLSTELSTGILSSPDQYENLADEQLVRISSLFGELEDNNKMLNAEVGTEDDGYIIESIEQMGSWGAEVVKSLVGSARNMFDNPGQTAAAAVSGAGAGSLISGPVATGLASTGVLAPAAALLQSFSAGIGAATVAFSTAGADVEGSMELVSRVQEYGQENGLNPRNPEDLKKIFSDKDFMADALKAANTKGLVTGGLEVVGGAVIPGVATKVARGVVGKAAGRAKTLAGVTLLGEGVVGGTSDVAGTVAGNIRLGEDLNYDELVENFGQEFVVELFTGGLAQGLGYAADNTVYKKSNNTANKIIEAAMTSEVNDFSLEIDKLVQSGKLTEEKGKVIVDKFTETKDLLKKVPDTEVKNKKDRRELVKNLMEREVILKKQSEIDSQINNSVTDAITNKLNKKKTKLSNLLKYTEDKIELLADSSINEQESVVEQGQGTDSEPDVVVDPTPKSKEEADEDYNTIFGQSQVDEKLDEDFNTIFGEETTQDSTQQETTQDSTQQETTQDQEVEQTTDVDTDQDTAKSVDQDTVFNQTTDRSTLVGQEVDYGGIKGEIVETESGYGVQDVDGDITEIEGGSSESTNQDLGISKIADEVKASYDPDTNTLQARGRSYRLVKVNRDTDGNPTSANVVDENGKKKTFKNKRVLKTFGTPEPTPTTSTQSGVETEISEEASDTPTQTVPDSDPAIESLKKSEETLDAAAELIGEDMRLNSESYGGDNPFTDESNNIGTARNRGLSGSMGRKANAGLMVRAFNNSSPSLKSKVKKLLGTEMYNEVTESIKSFEEASKKTTPTIRAKKEANKAIKKADQVRMNTLEKVFPGIKANFDMITRQAENISKSIAGVGIKIIDTPQEFSRLVHEAQGKRSRGRNAYEDHRGMFYNGEIFINLAKADATTLPHEAAHVIFSKFFGERSRDALAMHKVVRNVLRKGNSQENRIAREIDDLMMSYQKSGMDKDGLAEEFFAELVAKLVESESKITLPNKRAIIQLLNDMLRRFTGFTLFDDSTANFKDLIGFVNTVASGLQEGVDPTNILYNKGIIKGFGSSSDVMPKMQNESTSVLGRLVKKYFKDTEKFSKLEESGTVTNNRIASDFSENPMILHRPDFKFSGEGIFLDGDKVFTGNGGVFFPLLFPNKFWASTKDGAEPLLKHFKTALEASPTGTLYMGLVGSPDEKLISNANSSRDVFRMFNKTMAGDIDKDILLSSIVKNAHYLKSKPSKKRKTEGYDFSLEGIDTVEGAEALILKAMDPKNTSFKARRTFMEKYWITIGKAMTKEDQAAFKAKYGEKVEAAGMLRLFSKLLSEPFLHGQDNNNKLYAVLELSNLTNLTLDDIGDSHGAYPSAIGYDDSAVFKLHILQDRVHVNDLGIVSPRYGAWSTEEFLNEKGKKTTISDSILPKSSGISTGYVTIDPPLMQNPLPSQSVKPIMEDYPSFMNALEDDGDGNYVFYHMSDERRDFIDPSKMGSNPSNITSREELSAYTYANASMYYLDKNKAEQGTGSYKHVIKIPKEKVYPFNKDPLYLLDEARERYKEAWGFNRAFDPNAQLAWITKVASEHGYLMSVARWGTGFRAQSSVPLKEGVNNVSFGPKMQNPYTRLVATAEREYRADQSLKSPGSRAFNNPVEFIRKSADLYKKDNGFSTDDPGIITRLDKAKSTEIAKLYEEAVDSPNDPMVQEAYKAMAEEVKLQYEHMLNDGVTITLFDGVGEPYKNSNELTTDLRDNQRMFVFATESGYGTEGTASSTNALLDDSGYKDSNGKTMLVNDLFRAVHDYFGHGVRGNSFGAIGEENAWDEHVRMFSPLAARAMTAETRGQNSWVNFSGVNDEAKSLYKKARELRRESDSNLMLEGGSKAEIAAKLKEEGDRLFRFAEQKMTLLPEWVSKVGEIPPKMQNPRQVNYTLRDNALNNIVKKKESLFKRFESPEALFMNFKDSFNRIGVTLTDIAHLYAGLDPNKSVKQYAQEAQKTIDNFNEVMDQAGFNIDQKAAQVALYGDVAQRWAKSTGRTANEWWSDIIEEFVFAAQDSDIPSGDSVRQQSDSVIKSLLEKLKSTLPFTKARKYSNEANTSKETEPSTPLSQDKDFESTQEGIDFLKRNKNLIRGARKISDNRKAIVYISSSADVSTPAHELAHIYEMYMSDDDKAAFMQSADKVEWDVNTSEIFAIGFERFLSDGRKTSNKAMQPVFDNFRDWMRDIYNGLFKWGGNDIFLSEKMNELYSKMLSSPITNLDQFDKVTKEWLKSAKAEGVKYNKETMSEMADVLGFNLEDAFTRGRLRNKAVKVMEAGLFGTSKMLDLAMNFLAEEANAPGQASIGELQAMALDFEAGKLQRTAIELAEEVRQDPNNIELKNNLENVQKSISIILSALSLANSKAGATLGVASHRIRNEWFTGEEVVRRAKKVNPDITDKQLQDLRRLAKGVEEANRKVEQYKKDYAKGEFDRTVKKLDKNFRRFLNIPAIKSVIKSLKDSPKPLKDLEENSYKKLRDYYSTQMSSNTRSSADLMEAITLAMLNNPNINSVRDLTNHLIAQVPSIKPEQIVDVLNIEYSIGEGAVKTKAAVNNQVQDLKKELNLLDKLRNMIEGSVGFRPVTNKTPKSQRLLKEYIKELRQLSAQETNDYNFGLLYNILENVRKVYDGDFTGLQQNADGEFSDSDISYLLSQVQLYEDTRGRDFAGNKVSLREQIADLEDFIEDLEGMRYGKDTRNRYFDILTRINEKNRDQGFSMKDREYYDLKVKLAKKKALLNERASEVSSSKVSRIVTELANTPRALILSFDYSFMTYQLGFLTMKNLFSKNAFQQMKLMKMMVSSSLSEHMFQTNEDNLNEVLNGLYSDATINKWKQLGLNIPERGATDKLEESLRTKTILESAIKWALPDKAAFLNPLTFIRNFNERGYVTYVSAMRIIEAERMSKGITDKKVQVEIANRINTLTGAASQFSSNEKTNANVNAFLDQSANIFIAPRLYVSVFKSIWDLTAGTPTAAFKALLKKDPDMRKFYRNKLMSNLHILVAQGVSYVAISALVNHLDGDDEDDINLDFSHSNFLKTQVNDNVVTLSPYITYLRAGARLGAKAYYEWFLNEPYHTRGKKGSQSMVSAATDEFLKYRMNPLFGSYELLVNKRDFMGNVVESDTKAEMLVNVVLPSMAPISIQNVAKNIAEGSFAEIPGGMMLDMIGINSFRRDATSTPEYSKFAKDIGFRLTVRRPKSREGVDILSETQYNRYRQKVRKGVSERINVILKDGKKPSKSFIKRLQKSVEKEVLKELTD